ncbi:hypothetical protein ACC739_38240, partial [Rhizobium ruizarguesonis]
VARGPHVAVARCVEQVSSDHHMVAGLEDAALYEISNPEFPGDALQVLAAAFSCEDSVAAEYKQA